MRFQRKPSIYDHVRQHVPPAGLGLLKGGQKLPDEDELEGRVRWAAGAMDGVGTHHFGTGADEGEPDEVFDLVFAATSGSPSAGAFDRLYARLVSCSAIGLVDPLLERIGQSPLPPARIHRLGRRLAERSRHREPVKVGIALLGAVRGADDRELLTTLGRHEEFTVYSAVALANTLDDAESALWDLAKSVDGWGRIHLVEGLRDTERAEIKRWILREGFRNQVMYEYLAYIAATAGGLAEELDAEDPDDELLDAACEIISALVTGGPAEDLDDYRDAPRAVELLVGHLERRAERLSQFLAIDRLEGYLTRDDDRWPAREGQGWTVERREGLLAACRAIKARPLWRDLAARALDADDPVEFDQAERAARCLGIDTFPAQWRRVLDDPLGGNWWAVMQLASEDTIDQIVEHAERSLPLSAIASGPADEFGLGPEFQAHSAVDFIVQDLDRFPGRGWPLIATALRSPVVRNRNMALRALDRWGQEHWPADATAALDTAAAQEPRADVRERMLRLARGEPLDPDAQEDLPPEPAQTETGGTTGPD